MSQVLKTKLEKTKAKFFRPDLHSLAFSFASLTQYVIRSQVMTSSLISYLLCHYRITRKVKTSYPEDCFKLWSRQDKRRCLLWLLAFHSSHFFNLSTGPERILSKMWTNKGGMGDTQLLRALPISADNDWPHSLGTIRTLPTHMPSFVLLEIEGFCKTGRCNFKSRLMPSHFLHNSQCITSKDRWFWIQIPPLPLTGRVTGWVNWAFLNFSFLIVKWK